MVADEVGPIYAKAGSINHVELTNKPAGSVLPILRKPF